MQLDGRYKRLGKNTLLVFVGGFGAKLVGLLLLPFYTHYLTTSEYGVTDIIGTYSSILLPFVSCCIADAIFIYPKDADETGRKKYYTSGFVFALLSFVVCALLFFILHKVSKYYSFEGSFIKYIWWIFALTAVTFFQSYTQQFNRSTDHMVVYSTTGIILTITLAGFAFILLPKYGLVGYLWSLFLANIVSILYSFFASKSFLYISFKQIDWIYLKPLLSYGIPLIPNGVMWWLVNGINRPFMERLLGLSAIGLFSVANKFPSLLTMLFNIFANAWGISMLEEFKKPRFNQFFNQTTKMLCLVMLLGGCIIVLSSKWIIMLFADTAYYEAWLYIPLLTLGVIFQSMSGLIGGVFMAEKKSKYFFYSSVWGSVSSLLLTYVCIKWWGIVGASISIAVSFLVMLVVRLKYAWQHINLFDVKYYLKMMLLYILLIIITMLDINLFVTISAFVLCVGLMMFFNRREIVLIINKFKR